MTHTGHASRSITAFHLLMSFVMSFVMYSLFYDLGDTNRNARSPPMRLLLALHPQIDTLLP